MSETNVVPANAGMSPLVPCDLDQAGGRPRQRGDEPLQTVIVDL